MLTAESEEEEGETDGKVPTNGDAAADDDAADNDAADDDAEAQPERRRCQQCNHDRPEGAFAPSHWAGTNRGGENRRHCLGCAPHTTPNGQRFCSGAHSHHGQAFETVSLLRPPSSHKAAALRIERAGTWY